MTGKKIIFSPAILAISLLFSACFVQFDLTRLPPHADARNGTFTGTAAGWLNGVITVTLTISGGEITAAAITGEHETPGWGITAMEAAEGLIVTRNSVDFPDVLARSTVTTRGIESAARQALRASGATVP
ncbi:MAG: FMN-binding protein [Treponema sp.]|nr:FMN-binding protein [Treponema sp.]